MKDIRILGASLLLHVIILMALFCSGIASRPAPEEHASSPLHAVAVQVKSVPAKSAKPAKVVKPVRMHQISKPKPLKKKRANASAPGGKKAIKNNRLAGAEHEKKVASALKSTAKKTPPAPKPPASLPKKTPPALGSPAKHGDAWAQEMAQEMAQLNKAPDKSLKPPAAPQTNPSFGHYHHLLIDAISKYWRIPNNVEPDDQCKLLIRLAPGGEVLSVAIIQPSGNQALDKSARTAVMKASPLPVPSDPSAFAQFRLLELTVKPDGFTS
jgi:colicin import membrane protein